MPLAVRGRSPRRWWPAVKVNQGRLHEDLQDLLATAQQFGLRDLPHHYERTSEKDHGRIEKRECWAVDDADSLAYLELGSVWAGLGSVVMVKRQRRQGKETSVDIAYYISSLPGDARRLLAACRGHWSIENCLHWLLDVAFDEDRCRVRKDNAAQNFATLRRMALTLLKQDSSAKVGIQVRRLKAAWNNDYLLSLLQQ